MDNKKIKMNKKPKFKRQQLILSKLKDAWRKPKGIHSKLRLHKKGKGRLVKIGYGNDKKLKGLIKGQRPTYIKNLKDLESAEKLIIISSKIGLKKKLKIIESAKELKLTILNIKDLDKFSEDVKKKQEENKKKKQLKKEKKMKKTEKAKKDEKDESKKENKDEKDDKLSEEKKKVLEKGL